MGSVIKKLIVTLWVPLFLLGLLACGMGGTEIGNPRPGAEAPEGDPEPTLGGPTPSPSPAAIHFEEINLEEDQGV